MEYVLLVFSFITILIVCIQFFKKNTTDFSSLENFFSTQIQNELLLNREELSKNLKENRSELTQSMERPNETL